TLHPSWRQPLQQRITMRERSEHRGRVDVDQETGAIRSAHTPNLGAPPPRRPDPLYPPPRTAAFLRRRSPDRLPLREPRSHLREQRPLLFASVGGRSPPARRPRPRNRGARRG